MMKMLVVLVSLLGLALASPANAQGAGAQPGAREILRMGLYPPDVIMRHQQALGITDKQRKAIAALVREFQADVADLQWTLQNDQQIFAQGLANHPVPQAEALAQAEKVLALESKFKLAHFRLLIGIKNQLSSEQVKQIDETLKQRRKNGRL
ncbi:MAG: hypothetical protein KJN61_08200 [Gammaproteobacteria bacterium]|nr:hypothetical protein [Gammaproteobacteria bacterium]